MKHRLQDLVDVAEEMLVSLGIEVPRASLDQILRHLLWVLETNSHLNLTAVTDAHEGIRLHVVDSLTALPEVGQAPQGLLVDIGTGAGYPGLPLSITTGRRTLLLDSVGKKVRALNEFLVQESLESWVSVSDLRAEALAASEPGSASVVTARAVTELPSLVELSSPLLATDGLLVAMKGRLEAEELARGDTAAAMCGMRKASVRRLALPDGGEQRAIVTYRKLSEPRVRLPRRVGLAQNRPLA